MREIQKWTLIGLCLCLLPNCTDNDQSLSNYANEVRKPDFSSFSKSMATNSQVDIINAINGQVEGESTLHRSKNGLTVNYHATDLTPGYAYTLWWVIWNRPDLCGTENQCAVTDFLDPDVEVDVLYAAGHVIGASGKGHFSARLNAGDISESIYDIQGLPQPYGLQLGNSLSAEVHMVLRSHGPAVPGIVNEQINSYTGGCPNDGLYYGFPPFTEIPDEIGECGDYQFAIHPPVL
jgi:hypothetical protein